MNSHPVTVVALGLAISGCEPFHVPVESDLCEGHVDLSMCVDALPSRGTPPAETPPPPWDDVITVILPGDLNDASIADSASDAETAGTASVADGQVTDSQGADSQGADGRGEAEAQPDASADSSVDAVSDAAGPTGG